MDLIIDEKTESGALMLEGELTINRITEEYKRTLQALNKVKVLTVNVERATEVDLSFLQLLCSAHRTATAMEKSLVLTGAANQALQKAMQGSGYSRNVGCILDKTHTCLWVERKNE